MSQMAEPDIIVAVDAQRTLMIAVATGQLRIEDVNEEYKARRVKIRKTLSQRSIADPNPFADLWKWYGYWKVNLPSYQSRREYVADLYDPLIEQLQSSSSNVGMEMFEGLTGWARVDRGLLGIRQRLMAATDEEDYQTVGLLAREVLISLAQVVFTPEIHVVSDGIAPSRTDAKRMLDAYVAYEFAGGSNEEARRYVKAAFDLTNSLQHRRTATFRDAALCAESTNSVVNTIAILSGKRLDPSAPPA